MYGNTYSAAALATGATVAATTGWSVAGLVILAVAVAVAGTLTIRRLARRNRG